MQDAEIIEMLHAIRSRFLPGKAVVLVCGEEIGAIAPFTKNFSLEEKKIAAYVCQGHVCSLPAASPEKLMQLLEKAG